MLVGDIYALLDSISPFSAQEKWDNSGLNIGSMHQNVDSIVLALELDSGIANTLAPNTLVITHHPLIFSPLMAFDSARYPVKLIATLLEKHCALIAMHTNFDATHLNEHFAKEILGFSDTQSIGIAQMCAIEPTSIADLAQKCKEKLSLSHIRYTQYNFLVENVFIVCGAGASYAREIYTPKSCLICGDVKYHDAMMGQCNEIGFIDVEHYTSEREFAKILQGILQIKNLNATIAPNFSPFSYL